MEYTPPKTKIAPEKQWLEDDLSLGKVTFRGYSKLQECSSFTLPNRAVFHPLHQPASLLFLVGGFNPFENMLWFSFSQASWDSNFPIRSRTLHAWINREMPFFGRDEMLVLFTPDPVGTKVHKDSQNMPRTHFGRAHSSLLRVKPYISTN